MTWAKRGEEKKGLFTCRDSCLSNFEGVKRDKRREESRKDSVESPLFSCLKEQG